MNFSVSNIQLNSKPTCLKTEVSGTRQVVPNDEGYKKEQELKGQHHSSLSISSSRTGFGFTK